MNNTGDQKIYFSHMSPGFLSVMTQHVSCHLFYKVLQAFKHLLANLKDYDVLCYELFLDSNKK